MVNNNRKFLGIPALLSCDQSGKIQNYLPLSFWIFFLLLEIQRGENSIFQIRKSSEGKFKITCIISNFPTYCNRAGNSKSFCQSFHQYSIRKNLLTFHPSVHVRYVQKLQKGRMMKEWDFFSSSNRTTGYRMSTKAIVIIIA